MAHNLLIVGATGAIGLPITQSIISAKSHFNKIAILTSEATATSKELLVNEFKSAGLEIRTGDITKEDEVKAAYHDIDTVVCCVGRGAIDKQINLIKWASETNTVKWVFPSEFGTDVEHNAKSPNEKPHQLKLKVRAAARQAQNLEFTYVVTGPFADWWIGKASVDDIGTFDVKAKKAVLLGDGKTKVNMTAMADIGKLVVAALTHPEASRGKILLVNSFGATPEEVLAEFEKQTGSKWDVSYVSLEKLRELEAHAWSDGNSATATPFTLRRIWAEGGTLYDNPRDNGLIGDPEMDTLASQVRQNIQKQERS